jgi:hypothetical protein
LGRSWWLYNNPWHSYIFLLGMWWLSLIKHDIYSILRRAQIPSILGEKAPEQPCMDPKCFKPHPFASYGPMGCCLRRKKCSQTASGVWGPPNSTVDSQCCHYWNGPFGGYNTNTRCPEEVPFSLTVFGASIRKSCLGIPVLHNGSRMAASTLGYEADPLPSEKKASCKFSTQKRVCEPDWKR